MTRPVPRLLVVVLASLLTALGPAVVRASAATVSSTELTTGWSLRSATNVTDTGATISQPGYSTTGWYPITAPSTVLAGLVANNVYQNIYFGTNLQSVPDLTTLNANERREIAFTPAAYPALHVTNPVLWWPYQFGSPELYNLSTTASVGGA